MNKDILRACGFGDHVDAVENGKCPICLRPVDKTAFRDKLSEKEFKISGMCQECQDDFFETDESLGDIE